MRAIPAFFVATAILCAPLCAAWGNAFTLVDFTPASPAVTAHPPLASPQLGPQARVPLFDHSVTDNLRRALTDDIRMPPLTMPARAKVEIAWLGGQLNDHPGDPALLARRCFMRALAKTDLDAAREDCDRAIAQRPGVAAWRDYRALVFYVKGDYQAALTGYDQALASDPGLASALLMRGQTRAKLGDAQGRDRDIAAAEKRDANILNRYRSLGILPR